MRAKIFFILPFFLSIGYAEQNYYMRGSEKIYLTPVEQTSSRILGVNLSNKSLKYYRNENDVIMGVSDTIIVKLKKGVALQSLLEKYGLVLEKKLAKNLYLVHISEEEGLFETANALHVDKDTEFAQPNFVKKSLRR